MTEAAREIASRLSQPSPAGDAPLDHAARVAELCAQLSLRLSPWIGTEGYSALLGRGIVEARASHPILTSLRCDGTDARQIAELVAIHGAAQVTSAIEGLLNSVVDVLGRIVGSELATQLVAHALEGSTTERTGGHDD